MKPWILLLRDQFGEMMTLMRLWANITREVFNIGKCRLWKLRTKSLNAQVEQICNTRLVELTCAPAIY